MGIIPTLETHPRRTNLASMTAMISSLTLEIITSIVYLTIGIIPKVKLVPEAQPRDTNDRGVLSLLMNVGRKHILMARSIAEGPNLLKY